MWWRGLWWRRKRGWCGSGRLGLARGRFRGRRLRLGRLRSERLLAREWALDRHTFGAALATRQVIAHKLAEMARQVTVAKTYVRDVIARWAEVILPVVQE